MSQSSRSRNQQRGDFKRGEPKRGRAVSGTPVEKLGTKDNDKLTPAQRQAITDLEMGHRYAGRTFKRRKNPGDKPLVPRRPPMPNESLRTDMDRHGNMGGKGPGGKS